MTSLSLLLLGCAILLLLLALFAGMLYRRFAVGRARQEMKQHIQRIGAEAQYGSTFDPAARS